MLKLLKCDLCMHDTYFRGSLSNKYDGSTYLTEDKQFNSNESLIYTKVHLFIMNITDRSLFHFFMIYQKCKWYEIHFIYLSRMQYIIYFKNLNASIIRLNKFSQQETPPQPFAFEYLIGICTHITFTDVQMSSEKWLKIPVSCLCRGRSPACLN